MVKNINFLLCILLISTLFFACATRRFPEPQVPVAQAKADIEAISENNPFPDSMRLMTKIDYVDEIHAKRVVGQDLILSAQNPSKMRITISAFDKALSTLVSDGIGFALIDVSQNVYITGLATPENVAQILPVYLSASDLYRVIYGLYPIDGLLPDAMETQSFAWDESVGGYRRTLNMQNGLTENIFYDWPSGNIIRITVTKQDKTLYIYEASGFKSYQDDDEGVTYNYPSQIIFRLPPQKIDVRLRIESRDINVDFSPAVFRLLPPAGAKIIVLDRPEPVQNVAQQESRGVAQQESQGAAQQESQGVTETPPSESLPDTPAPLTEPISDTPDAREDASLDQINE